MLLSDAAKTGRKFRRRSEPDCWYWLEGTNIRWMSPGIDPTSAFIDAEQLVATDWEAEPLKLEVTADDVIRAARELDTLCSQRRLSAAEFGKAICIELGLLEEE